MVAVGGATVTLAIAGFTVKVALPFTPLVIAVMCAVPCATPVASPLLFTVAIEVASELQVKIAPTTMFPLESLATAMNCCVLPTLMDGVPGVTVTVATPPVGGCIEFVDPPPQPRSRRALKKTRDALRANRSIKKLGIFIYARESQRSESTDHVTPVPVNCRINPCSAFDHEVRGNPS
jgi:hypothetical protein